MKDSHFVFYFICICLKVVLTSATEWGTAMENSLHNKTKTVLETWFQKSVKDEDFRLNDETSSSSREQAALPQLNPGSTCLWVFALFDYAEERCCSPDVSAVIERQIKYECSKLFMNYGLQNCTGATRWRPFLKANMSKLKHYSSCLPLMMFLLLAQHVNFGLCEITGGRRAEGGWAPPAVRHIKDEIGNRSVCGSRELRRGRLELLVEDVVWWMLMKCVHVVRATVCGRLYTIQSATRWLQQYLQNNPPTMI